MFLLVPIGFMFLFHVVTCTGFGVHHRICLLWPLLNIAVIDYCVKLYVEQLSVSWKGKGIVELWTCLSVKEDYVPAM